MRKPIVAAIAAAFTVLAIFSDVAVAWLTPVVTNPHVAPWLQSAAPMVTVVAAFPAIVGRIRSRKYPLVES